MHLQPGHTVLDVGCGPGTDTLALAGLVGPSGRVVGVDADAAMVAEADRRAEQAGCGAWCRHQQADAMALPLETGVFDACRSERLFQHVHNPAAILAEIARVTRPGGWVVVLEPDWDTLSLDSPEVEIERRLARVRAEHMTNNGYAGRQLYGLFKRQQFSEITVELHPLFLTSYALFRSATVMERVKRDAKAAGLLSEEELQRWQQHLARGRNHRHILRPHARRAGGWTQSGINQRLTASDENHLSSLSRRMLLLTPLFLGAADSNAPLSPLNAGLRIGIFSSTTTCHNTV